MIPDPDSNSKNAPTEINNLAIYISKIIRANSEKLKKVMTKYICTNVKQLHKWVKQHVGIRMLTR